MILTLAKKEADGIIGIGALVHDSDEYAISIQIRLTDYHDQSDMIALKGVLSLMIGYNGALHLQSQYYQQSIFSFYEDLEPLTKGMALSAAPMVDWNTTPNREVRIAKAYADEALLRKGILWEESKDIESRLPLVDDYDLIKYVNTYSLTPLYGYRNHQTKITDDTVFCLGYDDLGRRQVRFPITGLPVQRVYIPHPGYSKIVEKNRAT